ncbi:MAG: GAF domain-containing protein, partial [Myxococcales bacterium]|nr:GAF domain-containing protein [Myxococcales bacterium]
EDLGSRNGTFVDGLAVKRRELGDAHYLRCGDVVFSFVRGQKSMPPPAKAMPTLVVDPRADRSRLPLETLLLSRADSPAPSSDAESAPLALADSAERLQVLLKVSELLSSPAPLTTVLARIVDLAMSILDIDRAVLLVASEEGGDLEVAVQRARHGEDTGRSAFSDHVVRWVVAQGKAALFRDATLDPRLKAAGSVLQQSIRACMCAPLLSRERLVGVLYVDNQRAPDRFRADDLGFLSAFAGQAAIAIDNARLSDALSAELTLRNTLERFFPPTSVDAIMASGGAIESIETEASVLFCDISGFTALSSTASPLAIIHLLNRYFPIMSEAVFRHEGTLEKYIGDAILAIWGAPRRHPDDALRAVLAAVDMQRAMPRLNAELAFDEPLSIHIGINSGLVAAGNIGSARYIQYATIGDTTNVAARICGVAEAGEIVIDRATKERMPSCPHALEPLPPAPVKGNADPLELFRVRYER